jgi:hypothetical protein
MPTAHGTTGGCLCGAITFSVAGGLREVTNCYCERCRRFTGHYLAATGADVSDVTIEDPTRQLVWHPVPGAAYGFCRSCGSSLFWRADASPGSLSICAGSVDPPTGLTTVEAWWSSQASDYFTRPDVPERTTE